jgi:hypothetical protein
MTIDEQRKAFEKWARQYTKAHPLKLGFTTQVAWLAWMAGFDAATEHAKKTM